MIMRWSSGFLFSVVLWVILVVRDDIEMMWSCKRKNLMLSTYRDLAIGEAGL